MTSRPPTRRWTPPIETPSPIRDLINTRLAGSDRRRLALVHERERSIAIAANRQTRIGWAMARAQEVHVEALLTQDEPLSKRWWAWTRLHMPDGGNLMVEGWAFQPDQAVRRVRRGVMRELLDGALRAPFAQFADETRDDTRTRDW